MHLDPQGDGIVADAERIPGDEKLPRFILHRGEIERSQLRALGWSGLTVGSQGPAMGIDEQRLIASRRPSIGTENEWFVVQEFFPPR